ncbi:MAG: response regulator [Candidatus Liptonbacteria bacterium]|nr:response regulator [Candidatus Liptonbacteria bacterium]
MRDKPLILMVDDDEDLRKLVATKLTASGYATDTAPNAKEGVAKAEQIMPDLILMDIHMPGATGTDAALELKQNPKTKNIRIVFLSSLKDPWPALSGSKGEVSKELGVEDFIDKTEDLDVLVGKVQKLLGK